MCKKKGGKLVWDDPKANVVVYFGITPRSVGHVSESRVRGINSKDVIIHDRYDPKG